MHRYEPSIPRVAFGIAAVAMTAITIGVLVVMPAGMQYDRHEPSVLTVSTVPTPAHISAVTDATIDVATVLATPPCSQVKTNHKPEG
jgi:hypothetical protein